MPPSPFPPHVQTVIAEFIPICRTIAGDQRYAISIGGSLGKGTWDIKSDIDFRLFIDRMVPWLDQEPERWREYLAGLERWKQRGVNIDGVWVRTVGEIETALDAWLSGSPQRVDLVWTIWGYHILPDIANQYVIEDPYDIVGEWKRRLSVYPPALKRAILDKYLESLNYWRVDYHYAHKVERGDAIFLAGMTSKLVHEMVQILFALNEKYYVGDGSNAVFIEKFKIVPPDFNARVKALLYPQGDNRYADQYAAVAQLMDEVIALARTHQ